jgi:uncharacterized protein YkwD
MAQQNRVRMSLVAAAVGTLVAVSSARAQPLSVLNALRLDGECRRAIGTPLRHDEALDAVARAYARSDDLGTALDRAAYPAASSTAFHVSGSAADEDVRQTLARRYCEAINDPKYDVAGVFQEGTDTWIVLAARVGPPPGLAPEAVAERVLALVNEARRTARRCGRKSFDAVPALRLSALLDDAASMHALDMAERGTLGHEGSDGSTPAERVTRAGYRWRATAENIAAGQRDAAAVVADWLESPGHCANLMGARFTEMGVAFAVSERNAPYIYWAQVFAAP